MGSHFAPLHNPMPPPHQHAHNAPLASLPAPAEFIAQFGIAADPDVTAQWSPIADDPVHEPPPPFKLGTLSFAGAGAGTRTSHVFFGTGRRVAGLGGAPHERPIGQIADEAEAAVVGRFFGGYGASAVGGVAMGLQLSACAAEQGVSVSAVQR